MASSDNDPESQAPSEVTPCLAGDSFLARHLLAWPGLAGSSGSELPGFCLTHFPVRDVLVMTAVAVMMDDDNRKPCPKHFPYVGSSLLHHRLWSRVAYHSHFTEEETEAQKVESTHLPCSLEWFPSPSLPAWTPPPAGSRPSFQQQGAHRAPASRVPPPCCGLSCVWLLHSIAL